jgi:Zn-dependent protease with chaperone function
MPKRRLPRGFAETEEEGALSSYDEMVGRTAPAYPGVLPIDDLVHPREVMYGTISMIVGIIVYGLSALCLIGLVLAPVVLLAGWISAGLHLGALRSRGIKVGPRQFPEVHQMVLEYSRRLNIEPPDVYVVCDDGLLNAFARRLHRKDIVVICSDVLEIAYEKGEKELAFIVCHELGHVRRGHVKWAWLHIPAAMIPFFGDAYSRACEYTCDRIARAMVPDGALFGLVALAAGTKLYRNVNLPELYEQSENEWGFWTWFHEIQSTHPNLVNRIRGIGIADEYARQAFAGSGQARRS